MRFSSRIFAVVAAGTSLALVSSGLVSPALGGSLTASSSVVAAQPPAHVDSDWADLEVGEIPTDAQIAQAGKNSNLPATRAKAKKRKSYAAAKRRARMQCISYGRWRAPVDDVKRASDIMRKRRTTIEPWGTIRIPKNPSWRWQSSLDYSGNGHMHSLFWALPLLRVGTATKNKAMVKRFYQIIHDWIKDNPPRKPRQASAYGQINAGYRMITLSCAFAGPAPKPALLLKTMATEQKVASRSWRAVNNASFHHAAGLFAMGCVTASRKYKKRALALLSKITGIMVAPDGSVKEGSVHYAWSTYGWAKQEMLRIAGCGSAIPSKMKRVDKIPNYVAMAIRPDRRYESIGDGHPDLAQEHQAPAGSWWQYSATNGKRGTRPNSLYRGFSSGILFGRSGWGVDRSFKRETFYSLRYGPGPQYQYHAHHDGASLTLAAQGSQLLVDPGQYRLRGGTVASYLRTRAAHNTVTVGGIPATNTVPLLQHAQSTNEGDYTAILDRAYKNSSIDRKVWYDRKGEFFVVMDDMKLSKSTSMFQNWNLGHDRTVAIGRGATHTQGSGANVSILSVGNEPNHRAYSGSNKPWAGWTALKYGSISTSPSVRVSAAGKAVRLVTVIVPRKSGVSAESVTASGELTADGAIVQVRAANGQDYRLQLGQRSVMRLLVPTTDEQSEQP